MFQIVEVEGMKPYLFPGIANRECLSQRKQGANGCAGLAKVGKNELGRAIKFRKTAAKPIHCVGANRPDPCLQLGVCAVLDWRQTAETDPVIRRGKERIPGGFVKQVQELLIVHPEHRSVFYQRLAPLYGGQGVPEGLDLLFERTAKLFDQRCAPDRILSGGHARKRGSGKAVLHPLFRVETALGGRIDA